MANSFKTIFLTLIILFIGAIALFFLILFLVLKQGPVYVSDVTFQDVSTDDLIETKQEGNEIPEETLQEAKQAIELAEITIQEVREYLASFSKDNDYVEKDRPRKTEKIGDNVKGLYVTGYIAAGERGQAGQIREDIENLVSTTQINALVIDVKEADGPYLPQSLIKFVEKLNQQGVWTIARIVTFADSSLIEEKPDIYLKSKITGDLWQDFGGRFWLDPSSREAQDYIIEFSKKIIDLGFDELQYDYVRFPTDGSLVDILYPVHRGEDKEQVLADFAKRLVKELKNYKPNIVLSVDLFGLVATKKSLPEIGQSIDAFAPYFDYLSFMLYPSHFYGGFEVPADEARNLPYLYFTYESQDINQVVSAHPYEVVYRSLLLASDYLQKINYKAKLRPWLQDFSLKFDSQRGIVYDYKMVLQQIKAVQDAGISGWLLWNPRNIYTKKALEELEDNSL